MRIDKWLWAVRIFKTRSLAAQACRAGSVKVGGERVKPARAIRVGETVTARTGDLLRTLVVVGLVENRVAAPAARQFVEDRTPPEEYARLKEKRLQSSGHVKGTGRPTKKERRAIEKMIRGR